MCRRNCSRKMRKSGSKGRRLRRTARLLPRPRNCLGKCNGLTDFRFHDLRHTCASWQRQAGTSTDKLKDLSGWKSRVMVGRYAKFTSKHLAVAASRIESDRSRANVAKWRFRYGGQPKEHATSSKCLDSVAPRPGLELGVCETTGRRCASASTPCSPSPPPSPRLRPCARRSPS